MKSNENQKTSANMTDQDWAELEKPQTVLMTVEEAKEQYPSEKDQILNLSTFQKSIGKRRQVVLMNMSDQSELAKRYQRKKPSRFTEHGNELARLRCLKKFRKQLNINAMSAASPSET